MLGARRRRGAAGELTVADRAGMGIRNASDGHGRHVSGSKIALRPCLCVHHFPITSNEREVRCTPRRGNGDQGNAMGVDGASACVTYERTWQYNSTAHCFGAGLPVLLHAVLLAAGIKGVQ